MQLVLREHWAVTVMGEWDFYHLENSAVKLLLLQEGKALWGRDCLRREEQIVSTGNVSRIS
jgi:hypothetical protein